MHVDCYQRIVVRFMSALHGCVSYDVAAGSGTFNAVTQEHTVHETAAILSQMILYYGLMGRV
jgi:hypothetical protein